MASHFQRVSCLKVSSARPATLALLGFLLVSGLWIPRVSAATFTATQAIAKSSGWTLSSTLLTKLWNSPYTL